MLPTQGFHDQGILLPGILLVFSRLKQTTDSRTHRLLLATTAEVLIWLWLAAFGRIALRPLPTDNQFYSKAVFVLPLRTAAVFPFVLFGIRHETSLPQFRLNRTKLTVSETSAAFLRVLGGKRFSVQPTIRRGFPELAFPECEVV